MIQRFLKPMIAVFMLLQVSTSLLGANFKTVDDVKSGYRALKNKADDGFYTRVKRDMLANSALKRAVQADIEDPFWQQFIGGGSLKGAIKSLKAPKPKANLQGFLDELNLMINLAAAETAAETVGRGPDVTPAPSGGGVDPLAAALGAGALGAITAAITNAIQKQDCKVTLTDADLAKIADAIKKAGIEAKLTPDQLQATIGGIQKDLNVNLTDEALAKIIAEIQKADINAKLSAEQLAKIVADVRADLQVGLTGEAIAAIRAEGMKVKLTDAQLNIVLEAIRGIAINIDMEDLIAKIVAGIQEQMRGMEVNLTEQAINVIMAKINETGVKLTDAERAALIAALIEAIGKIPGPNVDIKAIIEGVLAGLTDRPINLTPEQRQELAQAIAGLIKIPGVDITAVVQGVIAGLQPILQNLTVDLNEKALGKIRVMVENMGISKEQLTAILAAIKELVITVPPGPGCDEEAIVRGVLDGLKDQLAKLNINLDEAQIQALARAISDAVDRKLAPRFNNVKLDQESLDKIQAMMTKAPAGPGADDIAALRKRAEDAESELKKWCDWRDKVGRRNAPNAYADRNRVSFATYASPLKDYVFVGTQDPLFVTVPGGSENLINFINRFINHACPGTGTCEAINMPECPPAPGAAPR